MLRRQARYGRRNAVRSLLDRFFEGYAIKYYYGCLTGSVRALEERSSENLR